MAMLTLMLIGQQYGLVAVLNFFRRFPMKRIALGLAVHALMVVSAPQIAAAQNVCDMTALITTWLKKPTHDSALRLNRGFSDLLSDLPKEPKYPAKDFGDPALKQEWATVIERQNAAYRLLVLKAAASQQTTCYVCPIKNVYDVVKGAGIADVTSTELANPKFDLTFWLRVRTLYNGLQTAIGSPDDGTGNRDRAIEYFQGQYDDSLTDFRKQHIPDTPDSKRLADDMKNTTCKNMERQFTAPVFLTLE